MPSKKNTNSYSNHIGVRKAINPGIRVLIDFLNNYFADGRKIQKINDLSQLIRIDEVKNMEEIICKETDSELNELLYRSFFKWVESYSFYYSDINKNNIKYFLPLSPNMLYEDSTARESLMNIIFKLLYLDKSGYEQRFEEDKEKIEKYLFCNHGEDIYNNIIQTLENINGNVKYSSKEGKSRNKEDDLKVKLDYSQQLAKTLQEDLDVLLTNDYFRLDVYRRITLFSLLLNFYVTMYVIKRSFSNKDVYILAKGAPELLFDSENYHKACVENFASIREQIIKVSEEFYYRRIGHFCNKAQKLFIKKDHDEISIYTKNDDIWPDLKNDLFMTTRQNSSLVEFVTDFLEIDYNGANVERKALARAFVEWSKKKSSTVSKLSGMFSSQGKEAKMVYPTNVSKHKYYAMSSELTELLLKLFLASQNKEYATLEMFLGWLEERYGIYLSLSDKLIEYLDKNSIRIPSSDEFRQNIDSFIHTLGGLSAIEKLSDNSYMVYDSGKIGGVSWLI